MINELLLKKFLSYDGKVLLENIISEKKLPIFFLIFFGFFALIIELLGLGLVFPLIILIVTPEYIETVPLMTKFFNFLGFEKTNQQIIGILIFIGLILTFKNLYTTYYNYTKSKLFPKWKTEFSDKLIKLYLYSDYSVFLQKGSSTIIKNLSLVSLIY